MADSNLQSRSNYIKNLRLNYIIASIIVFVVLYILLSLLLINWRNSEYVRVDKAQYELDSFYITYFSSVETNKEIADLVKKHVDSLRKIGVTPKQGFLDVIRLSDSSSKSDAHYDSIARRQWGERTSEQSKSRSNVTILWYAFQAILFLVLGICVFWYYKNKLYKRIFIFCSNQQCYSAIYIDLLRGGSCPTCNKPAKYQMDLILGKCDCRVKSKYIRCPHCSEEINLFNPYNHEQVKEDIHAA